MKNSRMTAGCAAAFLAAFLLLPYPVPARAVEAVRGIRNDGESSGLIVLPQEPDVDISNLNPGDHAITSLELKNGGTQTLSVYLRTQIDSESSPMGGSLADRMELTISGGGSASRSETFRSAAQGGSGPVGTLQPGAAETLYFSTSLPGSAADNRYQGASLQVEWIFTAVFSGTPGGGTGGGGGGGSTNAGGTGVAGWTINAPSSSPASSSPPASGAAEPAPAGNGAAPGRPVTSPATGERFLTPIKILCASAGIFLGGGISLLAFRKIRRF